MNNISNIKRPWQLIVIGISITIIAIILLLLTFGVLVLLGSAGGNNAFYSFFMIIPISILITSIFFLYLSVSIFIGKKWAMKFSLFIFFLLIFLFFLFSISPILFNSDGGDYYFLYSTPYLYIALISDIFLIKISFQALNHPYYNKYI